MSPLHTSPSVAHITHHAAAGSRRYRSKAQRPCDLCRARKALCNIPDPTRPCQLCDRTGRPCTFLAAAKSRPMRASPSRHSADRGDGLSHQGQYTASFAHDAHSALGDGLSPTFVQPLGDMISTPWTPDMPQLGQTEEFMHDMPDFWSFPYAVAETVATAENRDEIPPRPEARATLNRHDRSTSFIGYSNESDPFLLEHYPYGAADELDFFMVTYRRPSPQNVAAGHPPIHFLQSKPQAPLQNQEAMASCLALQNERHLLNDLVSVEMGVALLRLVKLQDEKEFVHSTSPGILAGMYALAMPFTSWDEQFCLDSAYSKPDLSKLWRISYSCLQKELHFPSLSTVQMSLLLLNTTTFDPVAVETPFAWSLACSVLGIAQSLGLHIEPSRWKIPQDEVRLRRRLWWTVVVEHSWRSVTHGRSNMLREDDCNVAPLSHEDFSDVESSKNAAAYFISFCSLTNIVTEIYRSFFTLRAVSRVQNFQDLMDRAKPLQRALFHWLEALPPSLCLDQLPDTTDEIPDCRASLHIAYFTAHILLFRALLRPIVRQTHPGDEMVHEVLQESRDFMRALITVVRNLDLKYISAFWPAYTRHCLCYPGLFCYLLCFQKQSPHLLPSDKELFATWRNVLRARVASWPLLRFAVVKVDAVFWKKMDHTSKEQ
ncbi:fungal specific transcription factor domain protein [Cordyceps militaris CM01]|uniref:Fungal specific transcription factor domain protein n=1 Tax=Cordyceps militaris (strain CM01) TaxID=983644 RepID=G3JL99_CORMM|nr:fungal specific transcription factor domain protein [Cordyceps militaris CM01]EGX90473.1 fungal specific transcription factor domain protein [Cordyceps militaris CM01]